MREYVVALIAGLTGLFIVAWLIKVSTPAKSCAEAIQKCAVTEGMFCDDTKTLCAEAK